MTLEERIEELERITGAITEVHNTKMDLDAHNVESPSAVVIESQMPTADNNYTWYRKYSDGWVEQGGHYAHDNVEKTVTITIPVIMADTHYTITMAKELGSSPASDTNYRFISSYVANSKTVNSFQIWMTAANRLNGADWQVTGKAAI